MMTYLCKTILELMANFADKFANILMSKLSKESLEDFLESLTIFDKILHENSQIKNLMYSPIVQRDIKIRLITQIIETLHLKHVDLLSNSIRTIIKSGHLKDFSLMRNLFNKKLLAKNNITEANIHFVTQPSDKEIVMIEKVLSDRYKIKPKISIELDKEIIGGFIVYFDGKMLDASLNNSFNKLIYNIKNQFY